MNRKLTDVTDKECDVISIVIILLTFLVIGFILGFSTGQYVWNPW